MIDGIGNGGAGRVGLGRAQADRSVAAGKPGPATTSAPSPAVAGLLSEIAGAGPPVNADKIASIRAAIAEGRYPVDPDKIAEKMLALDLPTRPRG